MGWLQWVGFLISHVSFAKEPYKRDHIVQKRPIILRSLLIVATPYQINAESSRFSRDENSTSLLQNIVSFIRLYIFWSKEIKTLDVGWLRLVGSLERYVSFAKEPYQTDDILQKRSMFSRSLLIIATPYISFHKMAALQCLDTFRHTTKLTFCEFWNFWKCQHETISVYNDCKVIF